MAGAELRAIYALRSNGSGLRETAPGGRVDRALLGLMLTTGGDGRIRPDPVTRRNRYGATATPAPGEISFASTTANTISEAGFAAAARALDRLLSRDITLFDWFDEIRAAIVSFLGVPGSEAVLAASGTDAELLVLGMTVSLTKRPLTNILVAPGETGGGVPMAASGRHYSTSTALGAPAIQDSAVEGLTASGLETAFVPIRDSGGAPCDPGVVDRNAAETVARELHRGRDVLLHVLDTSKTGLTGVTRKAARLIMASAPGRVRVAVDACQLRCSLTQVKRDLADGFMVIATGSKFAGGPAFSGVVLLPACLAAGIAAEAPLAKGLASYSAVLDWPPALRERLSKGLVSQTNIGLGLRWAAALDGIASMAAVGEDLQERIADRFTKEVRARADRLDGVELHGDDDAPSVGSRSIVPLTVLGRNGFFAPASRAQWIHAALRERGRAPICHVGQAVSLGKRTVLRVAASATVIAGVASRMGGGGIERAFQPVELDLDSLFAKWSFVERQP